MVSRLFGKLEVNRQRMDGADCAIAGAASVVPAASTSPDLMTSRRFMVIPQHGLLRRSFVREAPFAKDRFANTAPTRREFMPVILGRAPTDGQSEVRGAVENSSARLRPRPSWSPGGISSLPALPAESHRLPG